MKYLIIFFSILLTGCATTQPSVIHETKTVYKPIPNNLLKNCDTPKPIDKNTYMSKDFLQKEVWLTEYSISLLNSLGDCNSQMKAIKEFNDKQNEIYNKP